MSCRQLKADPTKESSVVAANRWYAQRTDEIDRELGRELDESTVILVPKVKPKNREATRQRASYGPTTKPQAQAPIPQKP